MAPGHINSASAEHDAKTRGIDGAPAAGANKPAGLSVPPPPTPLSKPKKHWDRAIGADDGQPQR
jgi:hypothetical protein